MDLTDRMNSEGGKAVASLLDALTLKQREVLDLLLEFKTSKEISRILAISPHTVDQRIDAARAKLGASSRSDLALRYRLLVGEDGPLYERLTYEESPVADNREPHHSLLNAEPGAFGSNAMFDLAGTPGSADGQHEYRVVPELFDGRWGTVARLVTILAITILLCITFLGGLTILIQASRLLGG